MLFQNKNKIKLHCKQTHAVTQFSRSTPPSISQIQARWLCVLCSGTWQLIKPTGNNCVFSGSPNDFILPWLICTHHNSLWCDEYSTDKLPLSLSHKEAQTHTVMHHMQLVLSWITGILKNHRRPQIIKSTCLKSNGLHFIGVLNKTMQHCEG